MNRLPMLRLLSGSSFRVVIVPIAEAGAAEAGRFARAGGRGPDEPPVVSLLPAARPSSESEFVAQTQQVGAAVGSVFVRTVGDFVDALVGLVGQVVDLEQQRQIL